MHAVTKRFAATATGAALVAAWVLGSQGATLAQAGDATQATAPPATGPQALAAQLVELEDRFASRAIVEAAGFSTIQDVVEANDDEKLVLDQLATVTRLNGTFEELEDDFRALYEQAERAGGPVGGAVGDAARAWIVVGHGLSLVDEALNNDLELPFDAYDADDVAVGADYAGGLVDAALRTLMEGNDRLNLAHVALAQAPLDDVTSAAFTARVVDWESYRETEEPLYAALLSQPSTQVLVATERFVSGAAGEEARARSLSYVCVDRGAYGAVAAAVQAGDPNALVAGAALGSEDAALDCPSLPRDGDATAPAADDDD